MLINILFCTVTCHCLHASTVSIITACLDVSVACHVRTMIARSRIGIVGLAA